MLRTLRDRRFPAVLYNICKYLLITGATTSAKEYLATQSRRLCSDAACVDGTVNDETEWTRFSFFSYSNFMLKLYWIGGTVIGQSFIMLIAFGSVSTTTLKPRDDF